MGHSLPISLPWGRGSVGYFAEEPADRLVIFVHGFGGSALKTWAGMETLLDMDEIASSDVVFYGYGSLAAPVRNSASLFRDFVTASGNATRPWHFVLFRGGGRGVRDYKDVLIVAHSLGAVVARRALLDLIRQKSTLVSRVRMVLFGPAHMGTLLVDPMSDMRSSVGTILSDLFAFAKMKTPVLDDIKKGSEFLKELLDESEAAVAQGFEHPVKAVKVVFGEKDYVVETKPFCVDPLSDVWPNEDHGSVCRTPCAVHVVVDQL